MSTRGGGGSIERSVAARVVVLSVLLAVTGLVATAAAAHHGIALGERTMVPGLLLVPVFLVGSHLGIEFEFRHQTRVVTFGELPLAVAVVFSRPWEVLAACSLAVLIDSVALRRQTPVKVAFNVSVAVMETGAAVLAVSVAALTATPDYRLWLALFFGLLTGEVVGHLCLTVVMRWVGVPVGREQLLPPLVTAAATAVVFTCLAIVAVTSVWTEPLTVVVIAALAGLLTLAYRAHRRMAAREQSTAELYALVKDLGPLDLDDARAAGVLDQVRLLLHAQHLDLSLCDGRDGSWRHATAYDADSPPLPAEPGDEPGFDDGPTADLTSVVAERMRTPLIGSRGMIGILSVRGRLGDVRDFDMGDLRLLETVATELSTALDRGQLLAALGRAATTDPLTSLPNLPETCSRLDTLVHTSAGGILLAAIAVDSFREVNDTLGHEVGDALLLEVTARLRARVPGALVGRIGGGRFAVAVPVQANGGDAELFGLDLRAKIEGHAQLGAVGTHIRLSVGCVRAPEHGTDAATLLRRAETAMYGARRVHGGPVLWAPAYEVQGQRRLAVVMALREALASGAIGLAFQPKIDLRTGAITGVEALARWTHPALGAIPPDEFIPLAEAAGLMGPLTSTVLLQALIACKGWQRRAPGAGVAVNVSADTVLDPAFAREVGDILASTGLAPALLTLELTESVVVADLALAGERMSELRALGVKISVDDFGTGYSSLTYLKGLPVDEVKVDKAFVRGLVGGTADRAVIRAVVDISHTLGLRVVAEGVEDQDQHDLLAELGVDEAQGYLHARPMASLDMAAWLRRHQVART